MVYTSDYPIFSVTVDVVCLTVRRGAFEVLLVERGSDPFRGRLALPGGFVDIDEDLEDAARRELAEETALGSPRLLEQLATYGRPGRDPRGRMVSVAHLAIATDPGEATGGDDAATAGWHPVAALLGQPDTMAFDHADILRDGVERIRRRLEWSPLATEFCGAEFTIAQLRRVYEVVWGFRLDPGDFERAATRAEGFLVPTGRTETADGAPAELYRRGSAARIFPRLDLRPE